MLGVSGNDIKTALEVPAIGNIGDKQRLWNKHRDKMMMVQKVARLYGKATGDGRAIAVDKAITLTDTLLVDKGNGSKVQSLVNFSDRLGGRTVGRGNRRHFSKNYLPYSDKKYINSKPVGTTLVPTGLLHNINCLY